MDLIRFLRHTLGAIFRCVLRWVFFVVLRLEAKCFSLEWEGVRICDPLALPGATGFLGRGAREVRAVNLIKMYIIDEAKRLCNELADVEN